MKNVQLDHFSHKPTHISHPICFLAHDMSIPANVGGLFRVADALGVEKIYLTGTTPVPPNKKIRKTSRATEQFVSYTYLEDPKEIIQTLKKEGNLIISLEITSSSIPIQNFTLPHAAKVCLILGAESEGISQELLDLSDYSIHIPMLGQASSMNVVSACAIASYEIIKTFSF